MLFRTIANSLSRLVFPPHCYVCGAEMTQLPETQLHRFFCSDCYNALIVNPWNGCNFCGAYRTEGRATARYCVHCRGGNFAFDRIATLGMFTGLLKDVIYMIKKPEYKHLARAMAEALFQFRLKGTSFLDVDWIVPVPMNKYRFRQRGVNDAEIIAQTISEFSGKQYVNALTRSAATELQRSLTPRQRHENVRGVFDWRWWVETDNPPKSVLIVDDVLTTGATCNELAKMMKSIGVETVYVAVLARAVGDSNA